MVRVRQGVGHQSKPLSQHTGSVPASGKVGLQAIVGPYAGRV
jgi:hypothetical protein